MKIWRSDTTDNIHIWIEEDKPGVTYPVMWEHDAYEIYIVYSGTRYAYIKNKVYKISEGDVMMVGRNAAHRSFGDGKYSGICVEFSEEYIAENYSDELMNMVQKCFSVPIISINEDELQKLWREGKMANKKSAMKNTFLKTLINILFRNIMPNTADEKLTTENDMSPVCLYLQDNFLEFQGIEPVAEHFQISESYLCRMFKRQTGITISEYVNNLRMQYASFMLNETDMPIGEIYKSCGYNNSQYFNRRFKKYYGQTPTEIREESRRSGMYNYTEEADEI